MKNSKIHFCKILKYKKVLLNCFQMNSRTLGFHPQTQTLLEPHYTSVGMFTHLLIAKFKRLKLKVWKLCRNFSPYILVERQQIFHGLFIETAEKKSISSITFYWFTFQNQLKVKGSALPENMVANTTVLISRMEDIAVCVTMAMFWRQTEDIVKV